LSNGLAAPEVIRGTDLDGVSASGPLLVFLGPTGAWLDGLTLAHGVADGPEVDREVTVVVDDCALVVSYGDSGRGDEGSCDSESAHLDD